MDTATDNRIMPYSPEWFRKRIGAFTASEIYKLMQDGKAKEKIFSDKGETYILEKVHELLSNEPKRDIANFATQWGVENEPKAMAWYEKLTGQMVDQPHLVEHSSIEGFLATPDGLIGKDGLIEIKCPATGTNHIEHCFITTDEYFKKVHKEYYWQIQAQLLITGREWCDFVSFDPRINSDLGLFTYRLNANHSDWDLLEIKVQKAIERRNSFYELMNTNAIQTKA